MRRRSPAWRGPARVAGHRAEGEQTLGDVGVVLQHAGRGPDDAVARGPGQAHTRRPGLRRPLRRPLGRWAEVEPDQQVRRGDGGVDPVGPLEERTGLRERRDGETVPGGDHLVVPPRPRSRLARRQQPRAHVGETFGVVVRGIGEQLQHGLAVLERPGHRDRERPGRPRGVVGTERLGQRGRRPGVEGALAALAVGVQGRGEAAVVGAQLAEHPLGGLGHDPAREGRARGPPPVQVHAEQERVVVQHLLEVRHGPRRVDGVAREPAAELVVHPAAGHRLEGAFRHGECAGRRRSAHGGAAATPAPSTAGTWARRRSRRGRRRRTARVPRARRPRRRDRPPRPGRRPPRPRPPRTRRPADVPSGRRSARASRIAAALERTSARCVAQAAAMAASTWGKEGIPCTGRGGK